MKFDISRFKIKPKKNSQQKKALKKAFAQTREGKEANTQFMIASSLFLVFFLVISIITFNMAPNRVDEILPWANALLFFGLIAVYFDGRRSGALSMYREDHIELSNLPIADAVEQKLFENILTPAALEMLANIAADTELSEDLLTPAALNLMVNIAKNSETPENILTPSAIKIIETLSSSNEPTDNILTSAALELMANITKNNDKPEDILTPSALQMLTNMSKVEEKEEPKELNLQDDFVEKMKALDFDFDESVKLSENEMVPELNK